MAQFCLLLTFHNGFAYICPLILYRCAFKQYILHYDDLRKYTKMNSANGCNSWCNLQYVRNAFDHFCSGLLSVTKILIANLQPNDTQTIFNEDSDYKYTFDCLNLIQEISIYFDIHFLKKLDIPNVQYSFWSNITLIIVFMSMTEDKSILPHL